MFAPNSYESRRELMFEGIETVKKLWRGEMIPVQGGAGNTLNVKLFPMPMQAELPIWLTCHHPDTYTKAGEIGAGVLTNLTTQSVQDLARNIALYRESLASHGHDAQSGHVTVLLHTHILKDQESAKQQARQPFYNYLKSSFGLLRNMVESQGLQIDFERLSEKDLDYILSTAYERYVQSRAIIGTPESCAKTVDELTAIGVNEIGCFIDFGIDTGSVLEGFDYLHDLRVRYEKPALDTADQSSPPITVQSHTVGGGAAAAARKAEPSPFDSGTPQTAVSVEATVSVPLTEVQKQVWTIAQMGDEVSRAYNDSLTFRLRGPFRLDAMRQAVQKLVDRHEALRTTFSPDGQYQLIHHSLKISLPLVDFSQVESSAKEAQAAEWVAGEAQQAFDLARGPLIRVRVARLDEQDHLFVLTTFHIIADGQSYENLLGDLSGLYSAACEGVDYKAPLPTQFRQYAEQKTESVSAPADEQYWLELFSDGLPILDLPTDRERPAAITFRGARHSLMIGGALPNDLRKLSSKHRSTMFTTLLTAFKVLLHQLSGQPDIVVGINAAETVAANEQGLIGNRVSPLAIRAQIRDDLSFAQCLRAVKRRVLEAYDHRSYTAHKLLRKLKVRRDAGGLFMVRAVFNLERDGELKFHGLEVETVTNPTGSTRTDIYLNITEKEQGLLLDCDYNADLFDRATIQRWMEHFEKLLGEITSDSEKPLSSLAAPPRPEAVAVEAASRQPEYQSSNLTRYQQLVWVGQKLNPDAAVYITTGYIIIPARLDRHHFKKGIQAYVDHCEALRTIIAEEDGVPRQVVLESFPYEPDMLDFSSLTDPRAEAHSYLHQRCRIPLNMSERLFDFVMIELPGDQTVLFFNLHHIIGDSWSCALTSGFVLDFYKRSVEGRLDEPVLLHPFSDYVEFERTYLNSPRAVEEESYWKQKLAQSYDPITFYGKAPVRRTTDAQRISVKIGQERTRRLKEVAGTKELMKLSLDSSLSNMFAAILCTYLHHISGSRHISLGLPVHNRRTREFKETIGLFMQILPLRITIEADDTFVSLIDKISQESIENLRYSRFPIGNPVQKQAYDVEMNYINQAFTFFEGAPVEVQWLHPDHGTESFALQIHDYSSSGDFDFNFDFHCDVFEPHQRDQAIRHFLNVVDAFLDDNRQLVCRVNLLSPEEEHQILAGFNQTERAYPREKTLAQLFEEQVEKTPDNLAAGFEGQSLSYAQLNARANRMAHHLRAAGIGPETLVALLARRGTDLLTAILAVFKAGAAYLPLDPFYPKKRISQVLAQSKSTLIISSEEYLADLTDALNQLPAAERPPIEVMEELVSREGEEGNCPSSREPSNLAYVIYTSGSTGIPKGAMVEQSGMVNHLYAKIDDLALTERDKIAQTASQSFDISVWQFLAGLVVGGEVEIAGEEEAKDPGKLMELVEREGITVLETVPSMLRAMIEEAGRRGEGRAPRLEGLRWVLVTGEALPAELCREWLKIYSEIPLVNAYGPTECSDDITHYFITKPLAEDAANTPVGYPISNMRIYVLDREMEPVPVGVAGELFAGGIGVGRGYLRDAERTAAVFVPDPFGVDEGARLYRTGDLARWLPDGTIEFLGRVDDQVKVRGHRIELGEIESELQRHPAIKQAVVAARGDAPGDKRLVAYVVAEDQAELSIKDLRSFLKEKLPEYMVPSAFVTMEAFPLTPNGKLDRRALPAPEQARPELEEGFVTPRSREEEALAGIWSQVLGIPQVGVYDNFFELGGDSILSIQVAARANQAGLRISPMQLFEYQTVAELAAAAGTNRAIEAEQGMVTGDVTLTPIQRWFFELNVFDPHHFNQAVLFEARKSLTPEILEKSVERLLEHHDALRLRFTSEQSTWRQVNRGMGGTVPFALMDLSTLPESEQSPAIEAAAARTQASLDLSEGPLMRVVMFELGEGRPARLLIVIHHLAVDGVSWRILLEDLQMAYDQISRGEAVSLPLKTTSYKRWAERLAEYAQSPEIQEESNYWLDDARSHVEPLPRDFPDGINSIASGRDVTIWLGAEDTRTLLQEVPAIYQTQINDVLLMALAQSFGKWTGAQLLLVDLEGHGREEIVGDVDLSRTVGWFTSIYPLLLDLRGIQSPLGALNAVRQQLRGVPNRGIGYGLLRYLNNEPEITDRLRALPQPEVSFNYLGQFDQVVAETTPFRGARELTGPSISLREGHLHSRIRLLDVEGFVAEGQLRLNWTYSENVYRRSTIEMLAQHFAEALKTLVTLCRSGQEDEDADSSPAAFEWGTSELNDITSVLNKFQK